METTRIFIASSSELEQDRKDFREFLSIENDRLHKKGVYLELVQWEHFLDTVSATRLQNEYNDELKKSQIVICLFYTKAGKYTQEEFDTALQQFKETGSPLIYTYFKSGAPEPDPSDQLAMDLKDFKNRLFDLGHFYTSYDNIDDLKYQFLKQLDRLEDKGFIVLQEEEKEKSKEAVTNYFNVKNAVIDSTITAGGDVHVGDKIANTSTVSGNSNIVIQGVSDSSITVNVNGETKEIVNKLDALHSLLKAQQAQTFQTADKTYNIAALNEGSFGFITGKKAFNEQLTKVLIEAIQEICTPAQRFLEKVKNIPNWESQVRISDKAKEIIAFSFVGVIGVQLSKLMAIGKEDLSESKQHKYIGKSLQIVKRSLDLVCFALLSNLWDKQKAEQHPISEPHQKVLSQFFNNSFELSIKEQLALLRTLIELFEEKSFPLTELATFKACLEEEHEFYKVCQSLQTLNENLDKTEVGLLDCFDAESHLGIFLTHFRFLAEYNMVSIKKIGYQQTRNSDPHYLHRYAALGIDHKANIDAEKIIYTQETAHTNSVLLYKGENYQNSVNLFPFVIDYNALTFEHGAKICFYRSNNISDDSLEYLFLEDNSINFIEYKAILESDVAYSELMMDDDNRKIINLDTVVSQFREARKCILGDKPNSSGEPDFSDLFDED